jgi:hypothetical protein
VELGPFTGVKDVIDPFDAGSDYLAEARNLYPDAPEGGAWRLRPAWQQLMEVAQVLGAPADRVGQCVFQHTALDGTEYTVTFAGGKMYLYHWDSNWFENITPAGISIHHTNRIYCVTFADYLVVHDGANRPWKYAFPTATASYLTDINYALYGPWAVYYAKLFAIKNSARNTLIWSEELDPNTGYENVLYLNRWILGQTEQEGLEGIVATNAALYYFRPTSIGSITGAVTEDFQSTGTRDGVTTDVGTRSPSSLMLYDDSIWFVDSLLLRQYRITPGDQVEALWANAWKTYELSSSTEPELVSSVPIPGLRMVGSTLPRESQRIAGFSRPSWMMMYGANGAYFGVWSQGPTANVAVRAAGIVKDANKQERLLTIDNNGFCYLLDTLLSAAIADYVAPSNHGTVLSGAQTAIPVFLSFPPAQSDGAEVEWDTCTIFTRSGDIIAPGAPLPTKRAGFPVVELEQRDAQQQAYPSLPVQLRPKTTVGLDATTSQLTIKLLLQNIPSDRPTIHSCRLEGRAIDDVPDQL